MQLNLSENPPQIADVKEPLPDRTKSQVVINSANIVNAADAQLFPTIVNQISTSTGISLQTLSLIISVRSLLQAVTTPIWGWWNDHHSRTRILFLGCFIWGVCTILVGLSSNAVDLFVFRAITGIGLAVIIPTTNSLISDYFPPAQRGKAFGWLGLTGTLGALVGTVFATAIVTYYDQILGVDSWRFVFYVWGIASISIAFLVLVLAKDPPRGQMDAVKSPDSAGNASDQPVLYQMRAKDFKKILTNKTFMCIVLQGIAGSLPWAGITLIIAWLEYVGFSPLLSGLLFIIVGIGAGVGSIFGGWLGDSAAKWSPNKGRIIVAQISVFSGIPMIAILFFVIPMSTDSLGWYILIGGITGFMITWTSYATNNPIFAELFEPEIRGSVFSVDALLETSLASFGPAIVAWIAGMHGFVNPSMGMDINSLTVAVRYSNMIALAYGMFYTALIPWIICLLFYFLVYFTYPKDRDAARKRMVDRTKALT